MRPPDSAGKRPPRTLSLALYLGRAPRLQYPKAPVGRVLLPMDEESWANIAATFNADSWNPSVGDALRDIAQPAAHGSSSPCGPVRLRVSDGYIQLATRRADGMLLQTALHTAAELNAAVSLASRLGTAHAELCHDQASFIAPGHDPIVLPDPWYHLCLAPLAHDFLVAEVLEWKPPMAPVGAQEAAP